MNGFANSNNTEIAFFCFTPFHFFVLKNIIRHVPNAEFLIGGRYLDDTETSWRQRVEKIINLCQSVKQAYRVIPFSSGTPPPQFFDRYRIIVTAAGGFILSCRLPLHIKLVRVQYSQGKVLEEFGVWNRKFDLVLAQGPYAYRYLKILTTTKIVGYPKFDDWFRGSVSADILTRRSLDLRKKNILYLPTHGELSSLGSFETAVKNLATAFNVLLKPHHETVHHGHQLLARYQFPGIHTFDDSQDILELFLISSVILCDSGGAMFDALLADKPLVTLSVQNPEKFREKPTVKNNFRIRVTSEESVDELVKLPKYQISEVVHLPEQLEAAVQRAPELHKESMQKREFLTKKLFSFCDGQDGKRAADTILRLRRSGRSESKFLASTIDAALSQYQAKADYWKNVAEGYERIKRMPFVKKIQVFMKEFL